MSDCKDCGKRLCYGGVCPNCDEELLIEIEQGEYIEEPPSEEWSQKVGEQIDRSVKRKSGL